MWRKPVKAQEMSTWALDLGFLNAVSAQQPPQSGSSNPSSTPNSNPNSPVSIHKEKNKYGTLRSMFKRKSVTESKALTDSIVSKEEPANPPVVPALPISQSLSEVAYSPKPKRSVSKIDDNSPAAVKSPGTLRKKDSSMRYMTVDDKSGPASPSSSSNTGASARSPATSPGRKESPEEPPSATEASAKVEKLRMELELERKKSAALREEMEKVSGKSDASLLVRKALEEEVKRSAALATRVEALEKEKETGLHELGMAKEQIKRLKTMISDSGKVVTEQDARLASQAEMVKESQVAVQRMEAKLNAANVMLRRMEEERAGRVLAEIKEKRKEVAARDALTLVSLLRSELEELSASYLNLLPAGTERDARAETLTGVMDSVSLRVEPISQCVEDSGELDDSVETDSASDAAPADVEALDAAETRSPVSSPSVPRLMLVNALPSATLASPKVPGSGASTPGSAFNSPKVGKSSGSNTQQGSMDRDVARHLSTVTALDARNALECPLALPGRHEMVAELQHCVERARTRVCNARGDVSELRLILLQQEESFVHDLKLTFSRVWKPLQDGSVLSVENLEQIFGNWKELIAFHSDLHTKLASSDSPQSFLGFYSEAMQPMLERHEVYVENLTTGLSRLELARSRSARMQKLLNRLRNEPPRVLDPRWLLIRPLAYLTCLAEGFSALAGATQGVDDVSEFAGQAATLFRLVAAPVDMVHDKLALTCSNAKLRQFEIQLSDENTTVDLVSSNGRMLVDETEAAVVEASVSNSLREVHAVTVVLCSDVLFFLKQRGGSSARMLFLDLIPLSQLQILSSSSADTLTLANRAKSGVSFTVHFSSVMQFKLWNLMLRSSSEAAVAFYKDKNPDDVLLLDDAHQEPSLQDSGESVQAESDGPKSFVDTEDIQYTKDATTGRVTVRGGKPAALIRWLIHDLSGPNSVEEILQVLQSSAVCGSASIPAEVFMSTCVSLFKAATTTTERLRVIRFLSVWALEFASRDMLTSRNRYRKTPVFQSMMRFLDKCEKHRDLHEHLNAIKLGLLRGKAEHFKVAVALKSDDSAAAADLEEISPGIFGEQLTVYVHSLLAEVTDLDLYQGDQAPRVAAMIQFWNELSDWCIAYLGRDDGVAVLRLRRFLAIARKCIELNNFDTAFALGLALDSCKLPRGVIENVGKAGQEVIDMLNFITNVSRGFSNYRSIVETLEPPAIPYLAISLKDVVLIRENDNFIEKSELINYRKLVILGSRLRLLLRFKRVKYHWIPSLPNVVAAFRNLPAVAAALKSRPLVVQSNPLLAQQLQLNLSDSPKTQSKFQTLKRSVLSFSPRTEGSLSNRDKSRGTVRTSKRPPLSTEERSTVVVLPSDAGSRAGAAPPLESPKELRSTSPSLPSASASSSSSPSAPESPTRSSASSTEPTTSSRWSRALPRQISGGLVSVAGQKTETTSPRQEEQNQRQEEQNQQQEEKPNQQDQSMAQHPLLRVHLSKTEEPDTSDSQLQAVVDKSDLSCSSDEQEDEKEGSGEQ